MSELHARRVRSRVLSAAVGGALAVSLLAVPTAQAALGGAAPATFSNRPNLESVTFNGNIASFNFDRSVQNVNTTAGANARFQLAGYRSGSRTDNQDPVTVNASVTEPSTVLVTYPTDVDIDHVTYGTVAPGALTGLGTNNNPNLADSTHVTDADGETGTVGHTHGPDLQSAAVDLNNNRILYTFDQSVDEPSADPTRFFFVRADGTFALGNAVAFVDDNVVAVGFGANVDQARRAGNVGGGGGPAVLSANDLTGGGTTSVGLPGQNPVTNSPSITSAELEVDAATAVFQFDQPVANPVAAQFFISNATGGLVQGQTATVVAGNQVRVTLPGGSSQFIEQLVFGFIDQGAVTDLSNTVGAAPGGAPLGGNAGAKATGYTSAPDALAATVNRGSGLVTLTFDSRLDPTQVAPGNFTLFTDTGQPIAAVPTSANADVSTGPGQSRVFLQYSTAQVSQAVAVQTNGNQLDAGGVFQTVAGNAAVRSTPQSVASGGLAAADSFNVIGLLPLP